MNPVHVSILFVIVATIAFTIQRYKNGSGGR
jgi:hypothetical protein